ncbi:MAG: type I secretion system permease/ATPase [Alphaproteobacteria bacterium]|nr:type I secretion system permease/ATPase [Alphaproteobacteria bacterium]
MTMGGASAGDVPIGGVAGPAEPAAKETRDWSVPPGATSGDDPLAFCLVVVARLLERPSSAQALTGGLPLADGKLTPELFVRAAERAGLSARLVRLPLEQISPLSLPCVLLLRGRRACVLTGLPGAGEAEVLMPEDAGQPRRMSRATLDGLYQGYALFARAEYRLDDRARAASAAAPEGNWFWSVVSQYRKLYGEVIAAAVLVNLLALAAPIFTMNVYDRVVPNQATQTLWVLAIGVMIAFGFEFLLRMLRGYFIDTAGRGADLQLSSRLFEHVLAMRMAARPASAGALASNLRDFEHLREFFTSASLVAVIDLPFVLLYILIVFIIGGVIGLIPLMAIPAVLGVGFMLQAPLRQVVRQSFEEQTQKHAVLVEAISGIETIKATNAESRLQRTWEGYVDATSRTTTRSHGLSLLAVTFAQMAANLVNVLVVIAGVYLISGGHLTVGGLVACTILSGRAMAPLGQVASLLVRFHQTLNSLRALDKLMQLPVDRPAGRSYLSRPRPAGAIEFRNVTFAYPGQRVPALQGVTFRIQPGEKVGLIGRIGSGKSTIERLIMGLYEPQDGAVLIDGVDARQIDPAELRRSIGCVLQENFLFFGSIKDNIVLGAFHVDDAAILRAARIAGVDEFTSRHPQGLDMPVGEGGRTLSGGQRQSVAIARAMLFDPPILLLDEPTSSMDNSTENRFKARLQEILPGRTLVLVTHRGSMLTLVDRLIVLDGGRIVADGPKDDVMNALARGQIQAAQT